MFQTLKAIHCGDAFIPQTPCDLPDVTEVELVVRDPRTIPPTVTGPEERNCILKKVVDNMPASPLLADSHHRFTREELH